MKRPNIFSYATRELSQDAMICWLIAWSEVRAESAEDQALSTVGRAFVNALLSKHGRSVTGGIRKVTLHRQKDRIDVLALVEDQEAEHVLLIEDKTGSDQHGGQLKRYLDKVERGESCLGDVEGKIVCPIFLKTGNQSAAQDGRIENPNLRFKVFHRSDWLTVLKGYQGDNVILRDFQTHLQKLEADFLSYESWKEGEETSWTGAGWQGLFRNFETSGALSDPDWCHVPQRDGGFWAFYWCEISIPGPASAYLQLEVGSRYSKLCFKIDAKKNPDRAFRQKAKKEWNKWLKKVGCDRVGRPRVLRIGNTMTVAAWTEPWMVFTAGKGPNIAGTLQNLKAAESILLKAVSSFPTVDGGSRGEHS